MVYQGVRNAARKALVHHGGHNGPGASTSANQAARSINSSSQSRTIATTVGSIRPRGQLFSVSRNLLQRFFAHLTAPGFRAPTYLSDLSHAGSRSLHATVRGNTIQSGLSLPARQAIRNNALQRQANTFLPRAPGVPPRCGGIVQVGLGTARNFSTARPIFQNLAQNVPVAGRALYEIDWDIEMRKEQENMRLMARSVVKKVEKSKEMLKPTQKRQGIVTAGKEGKSLENIAHQDDIEHYFASIQVAPVNTHLFIPLSPTQNSPLSLDPSSTWSDPSLLPPLSYLGSFHVSHATHALRVSTLFARLDQAHVWTRGARCSAYSQERPDNKCDESVVHEGVCTVLKVEFVGWSKAEVRSVIGESGSGWCGLEEVSPEEDFLDDEGLSDMDSLSSGLLEDETFLNESGQGNTWVDPAQSLILPTLDFSCGSLSSAMSRPSSLANSLASIPSEMETDPWVDDYPSSPSSRSSLHSHFSEVIVNPPSSNGWFDSGHVYGPGPGFDPQHEGRRHFEDINPREGIFY